MHSECGATGKKAAVLFSTRFGTTEKVARALERGLHEAGMQTTCRSTSELAPESLGQYDLICVGGPTEAFGASKPMKEFLKSVGEVDLEGKFGFAFDTKLDSRFSGSASKYIEHVLDDDGVHIAAPHESAIVNTRKQGGQVVGADLKDGEERRFEEIGRRVAVAAAAEIAKMSGR